MTRAERAQKRVIQRVKKSRVVVLVTSVGSKRMAPEWKKSRVWSSAMIIIANPRRMPMD